MKNSELRDEIHDTWNLLAHTYRLIGKLWNKEVSKYGFSREQALNLLIIKHLGDNATPYKISRFQVQEHNSVSDILNRMVKQGLIVKIRESRGKSRVRVSLTKQGEQAYKKSLKRDMLVRIMSALPQNKLRQLTSHLRLLREAALKEAGISQEWPEIRLPPSQWAKPGVMDVSAKEEVPDTVEKAGNPKRASNRQRARKSRGK